ncbi:hypothetical protein L3X38_038911 [Prunus dulcis]|uniref:Uncharacterized protein n=1 Tax=Prunus dulcis TaxID=3755 RepID=A0AAD4V6E7_PRUDU|nr:hypothetical protein L3X38_038911 [Prunus dulcis]
MPSMGTHGRSKSKKDASSSSKSRRRRRSDDSESDSESRVVFPSPMPLTAATLLLRGVPIGRRTLPRIKSLSTWAKKAQKKATRVAKKIKSKTISGYIQMIRIPLVIPISMKYLCGERRLIVMFPMVFPLTCFQLRLRRKDREKEWLRLKRSRKEGKKEHLKKHNMRKKW